MNFAEKNESVLEIPLQERIKTELQKSYGFTNVSETYQKIIAVLREGNYDSSRNAMQKMLNYTKAAIDETACGISSQELQTRMGCTSHHPQSYRKLI